MERKTQQEPLAPVARRLEPEPRRRWLHNRSLRWRRRTCRLVDAHLDLDLDRLAVQLHGVLKLHDASGMTKRRELRLADAFGLGRLIDHVDAPENLCGSCTVRREPNVRFIIWPVPPLVGLISDSTTWAM